MSINANELRVGNWVSNGEKQYTVDVNMLYDIATSENFPIDPIPLTPEILLACGFVLPDGDAWYKKDVPQMEGGTTELSWCKGWLFIKQENEQGVGLKEISEIYGQLKKDFGYVPKEASVLVPFPYTSLHQLQNLYFALTGTELNYSPELFKPTNA